MPPTRNRISPDERRRALDRRLGRLKRASAVMVASAGFVLWALVAGALGHPATTTASQPPRATSEDDQLRAKFFGNGSFLGTGIGRAPVLRSHGS